MKISKIAVIGCFLFWTMLVCPSFGADVAKIGVVDFQKIFDASVFGKEIKAQINKKGQEMETDLKKKGAAIEELKKRLERESLVMSKEMQSEKQREFRIKINDIKMLQKKYEREIQGLQKRLIGRIKKDVLLLISETGKKEGYLLIIEKIGVLYAPNSLDITDQIIKEFNENYTKKSKAAQ